MSGAIQTGRAFRKPEPCAGAALEQERVGPWAGNDIYSCHNCTSYVQEPFVIFVGHLMGLINFAGVKT